MRSRGRIEGTAELRAPWPAHRIHHTGRETSIRARARGAGPTLSWQPSRYMYVHVAAAVTAKALLSERESLLSSFKKSNTALKRVL